MSEREKKNKTGQKTVKVGEMAQLGRQLAAKTNVSSLIPGANTVKGKRRFLKAALRLHTGTMPPGHSLSK